MGATFFIIQDVTISGI